MRLIDADAFVEAIKKDLRKYPEDDLIYPVMEWFLDNIKGRPTIEQPQWISCAERLPTETGEYIVTIDGLDRATSLWYSDFRKGWYDFDDDDYNAPYSDVTHWMPLPMPPKGDEG